MSNSSPQADPLRVLIAGGGTGGHVLPAVAVVEELRRRDIPMELLWVGSHLGVERQIAADNEIDFRAIQTGKLRRYFSLRTVTDALRVPVGVAQGWRIVRGFRPNVIYSTGGNVSVPTVVGGARVAPILTHEQTAQIGIANRTAARFADRFAVTFADTVPLAERYHSDVVVTGNPVRASLTGGNTERGYKHFGFDPSTPVVFLTGGARGSTPLNVRLEGCLEQVLEHAQVVHQTGPASANPDYQRLSRSRDGLPAHLKQRYYVTEFVGPEIADLYAITDLVIARAGAGTITELAYTGTPSILIPLPGTWGDEQRKNARVLGDIGGAVVLEQDDVTPDRLGDEILRLVRDDDERSTMAEHARSISVPDATSRLVDELLALAKRA